MLVSPLAVFGAAFAALFVAHQLADHWIQTDRQACRKALPGWPGRIACTWHVATYTATCAVLLAALHLAIGLPLPAAGTAAGLAVSGVTHWLIDRRWPLFWLAEHTGSKHFVRMGAPRPGHDDNPSLGTGAYALDQSAHYLFLLVAALILAACA
ncbi:DUF3307 domain-containing protein [Actinocatenispora sera]|uniref:DUF3307 domain-containing protein n=1 Tax=Actinocatenispora sera TaxID=390989 RepID=A0A810KXI3_9ACTN|nr:DUF3307 domain-containing protein [Actinocatenispora sera]BCJ27940.1 hypothetical protein Asera_20480 [Actinocatenispora sera]